MTITVQNGQNIFDIAALVYGDASMAYNLIAENPSISNILSDLTGMTLNYTPGLTIQKEAVKKLSTTKKNVTMQSTQTLFDLALQYYGSAENIYQLLSDNSAIENILSIGYIGTDLNYTQNKTIIPTYFLTNNIDVATRFPYDEATIPPVILFLLQEDGFFLLQENGDKIIL